MARKCSKTATTTHLDWKPKHNLSDPQPPPQDENKILEAELANACQMIDGKLIKKNGGMGSWLLVCCFVALNFNFEESECTTDAETYVPHMRPVLPYIIDVGRLWAVFWLSQ
jgi:polyadenylation factor subunit 2